MGLCLLLGFQGSLYASSLGHLGTVLLMNNTGEDIVILGALGVGLGVGSSQEGGQDTLFCRT